MSITREERTERAAGQRLYGERVGSAMARRSTMPKNGEPRSRARVIRWQAGPRCMPMNWYIDFVVCGDMYTQAF